MQRRLETQLELRQARAMPIYEFHCEDCGAESEILVRSSDWKGTPCPKCGSKHLEKKFSVFASSGGDGGSPASAGADCSGNPRSCGRCCGGGPHHH
ncbi:MAG: zinc ribbon domain-containing protein [Verrucomicrobiales bacterium]|nr:zinc ribbon domain-containing protein [Verrucomicrobiales bacterium]